MFGKITGKKRKESKESVFCRRGGGGDIPKGEKSLGKVLKKRPFQPV